MAGRQSRGATGFDAPSDARGMRHAPIEVGGDLEIEARSPRRAAFDGTMSDPG